MSCGILLCANSSYQVKLVIRSFETEHVTLRTFIYASILMSFLDHSLRLQDILRLLTLWFNHGATAEVQMALQRGFAHVNINTWLVVLPQIIARIHSNNYAVRELIQSLLVRIGQNHPQVWLKWLFVIF